MIKKIKPTRKWKGKTPLTKVKNKLWNTIREYTFNRNDFTCYTCNAENLEKSNLQLGHFHPGSTCPIDIYFHLDNLRTQCMRCNVHLSGNPHAYRERLLAEIGEDRVDYIDTAVRHKKPVKWSISDYEREIERVQSLINVL